MATTQEFYRLGSRLPRYTTKLTAFAQGMYLTNQMIPEGYAKAMINYDIDDTGNCIRPRRGREVLQTLKYPTEKLGPISLTDYIYAYNKDETEVADIKDLVLSYGTYTAITDLVISQDAISKRPIYLASMDKTIDTNVYYLDEQGQYQVQTPGTVTERSVKEFWAMSYNKVEEHFDKVINKDVGYVTARTIENAYAFEKAFHKPVGRPIGTVLNNELIAFAGSPIKYKEFKHNPERNEVTNFGKPELTKLAVVNTDDGLVIKRKPLTARVLNPLEASSGGYNILSSTPYTFEDEKGGSLSIIGMLLYDDKDRTIPIFNAKLGNPVAIRVHYQYPTKDAAIKYKVEILDTTSPDSKWEVLEDYKKSFKAGEPFFYTITPKTSGFAFRVTLRVEDDTTTEYPAYITIVCNDSSFENLQNKTFDLSTCKGMISWQGCVGVYGVADAPDTIFFSDVEDPSYFPFPNNIMAFDNEVLAVHNYLDHLIVVTVDSVWLVSAGPTIQASIQKRILANLHIPEIDAINLVVLKDQIFFKTDTQFYVLKPNQYTSDSTDLKNYVNSTAIASYTLDFQNETVKLLNKLYPSVWQRLTKERRTPIKFSDFTVYDTRSVVRDAEVHYIYTIEPILSDGKDLIYLKEYLNLHLVYNTLTRSWRMYLVAIGNDSTAYAPILYRNKQSGSYYEFFPHDVSETESNIVVTKQTNRLVSDDVVDGSWNLVKSYDNYTYLDTGNLALDDVNTKRFRECQFNLLNMEHTQINFYADFLLDGQERIHATKYETRHITDERDPDYGKIFVTPIEQENLNLCGLTALAEDITQTDHWALDLSHFPDLNVTTVRFQLQGRGRRGALQLLNTSLQRYELSDLNWVYRTMSAR